MSVERASVWVPFWVFLKILSDDFGNFRGISVPLLQIQNETV
jgi:hypothetical protein